MPPFYAQQMIAASYQPVCVAAEVTVGPEDVSAETAERKAESLDVTATRSEDGRTVAVKVVNLEAKPASLKVLFDGYAPRSPTARVSVLTGDLPAVNTPEASERIVPREHVVARGPEGFVLEIPGHSFTVARFE
jgi:alpha-L-arabinofuranosidase